MKKLIILSILSATILIVQASEDKYIEALRNCSPYNDSGGVTTDGISVYSKKQILGWQDNKCRYKESIELNGARVNIMCNFTKPQINEITSVADAYFLTLKYSNTKQDLSQEAIQNNPLVNVFNKYLQNPSVCTMNAEQ